MCSFSQLPIYFDLGINLSKSGRFPFMEVIGTNKLFL